MKKIILTVLSIALLSTGFAQTVASAAKPAPAFTADNASFNWIATTFDFGKIKQNIPVTHEFTFTNSGTVTLVITSVQASCGCTVTEYTKDVIAPGAKGLVKATYNAAKTGVFTKTVTVNANTEEGIVQLTIKGEVTE